MSRKIRCAAAWVAVGVGMMGGWGEARGEDEPPAGEASALDLLRKLEGSWAIEAEWAWGEPLVARAEFTPVLGGAFVDERIWVRRPDGEWYQRYRTTFAADPDRPAEAIRGVSLAYDGGMQEHVFELSDDGQGRPRLTTQWTAEGPNGAPTALRQHLDFISPEAFRWTLSTRAEADRLASAEWSVIMDGVWRRSESTTAPPEAEAPAMREAAVAMAVIDAAEESERAIERSVTVPLPPAEVWRLWTTSEGVESWLVDEAHVELRIGGPFELYFLPDTPENRGARGSEGCRVLSYLPERMLSTTWNAPPTFPAERREHTRLVIELDPTPDGGTRLTLTHTGWPTEVDDASGNWPKVYAYFDRAWSAVMGHFARYAKETAAAPAR